MAGRRLLGALIAGAIALSTTTACEPPPPRLQLVVQYEGLGRDDNPGDGICRTSETFNGCTLPAAMDEANASPTGADIRIFFELDPEDPFRPEPLFSGLDLTVTGDVRVIPDSFLNLGYAHIDVAPTGTLYMSKIRLDPYDGHSVSFRVEGTLHLDRSVVEQSFLLTGVTGPALDVTASGTALLTDSIIASDNAAGAITNDGTLAAVRSSIIPLEVCPPTGPPCFGTTVAVNTLANGETHLAGSAVHIGGYEPISLAGCAGRPPISHGYVHQEVPCGGSPASGDSAGPAGASYQAGNGNLTLASDSPLVDAIPLTDPLCADATVDVHGVTRGLDGNGDGIRGCEIGALER